MFMHTLTKKFQKSDQGHSPVQVLYASLLVCQSDQLRSQFKSPSLSFLLPIETGSPAKSTGLSPCDVMQVSKIFQVQSACKTSCKASNSIHKTSRFNPGWQNIVLAASGQWDQWTGCRVVHWEVGATRQQPVGQWSDYSWPCWRLMVNIYGSTTN